jgi:hypothetical protein
MVIALSAVVVVAIAWPVMTFFTSWQKDAPTATGLGNIYSEQYREGVELSLRQQRALAAFFRRTMWPVLAACGVAALVLILIMAA